MSNVRICRKSVPKTVFCTVPAAESLASQPVLWHRSRSSGIAAVIAGCGYIFQLFLLRSGKAGISAVFAGCGLQLFFQLFL